MNPYVSFIIPAYNCSKWIGTCLDSIINQDIDNYEIVVVNDGSLDNTLDILNEYHLKYDFIKIINQKNSGPAVARQTGINNACGDYFAFIDSDDYYLKDTLKDVFEILKNKNIDILRSRYEDYDIKYNNYSEKIKLILNNKIKSYVWLLFIKREIALEIKFDSNLSYFEDLIYYMDLFSKYDFYDYNKHIYHHNTYSLRVEKNLNKTLKFFSQLKYVHEKLYNEYLEYIDDSIIYEWFRAIGYLLTYCKMDKSFINDISNKLKNLTYIKDYKNTDKMVNLYLKKKYFKIKLYSKYKYLKVIIKRMLGR